MQLPAALQPWSEDLELLAADLRFPLGGVVQKLASVIGPLAVSHSAWDGEPDGFDGLARRGPYDRLLATEWLLAEEAPDEFVRRAAMSEHVFLRLARPEPAGDRLTVALFDAGPSQIGTPRLVHLALLILLARRAQAAHARFGWGIVQEPQAPLGVALDEAALTRLLEARTARPASADDVAAWSERIGAWKRLDESWWIGGAPLARLVPGRASHVVIEDVLEPGVRRVDARVAIPGRLPATVPLELPPDGACTRLLRDPFGTAVALARLVEKVERPQSNLVLSFDGNKVYSRSGNTRVLSYSIPNSPRAPVTRPKTYETYRPVLAVGRHRRATLVATCHHTGLLVQRFGKNTQPTLDGVYVDRAGVFDHTSPDTGPLRTIWGAPVNGSIVALVTDRNDRLFALSSDREGRWLSLVAEKVLAASWVGGVLLIAERADHGERGVWLSRFRDRLEPVGLLAQNALRVLFGNLGGQADPTRGPLAFNTAGREWCVRQGERQTVLIRPEQARVVGVGLADGTGEAGLIVHESDRRKITILGRNWEREIASASSPIDQVALDPWLGLMAYTTRDELVVLRLHPRVVLARMPLA